MEDILTLCDLGIGEEAIVHSIGSCGHRRHCEHRGGKHIRQRLINLGIFPGVKIKKVRANRSGPVVLNVQDSQVMIGRGMARHIYVRY